MNKIKINNRIYDIITDDEYIKNKNIYDPNFTAIQKDDTIYPIRKNKDTAPGYYSHNVIGFYVDPREDDNQYKSSNSINFSDSKSIKEIYEKTMNLKEMERSVLTDADNITIPRIKENDQPEIIALKEAIIAKHIDINKYEHKFNDFGNDIRLLEKNKMTLGKLKVYGDALDMKISLTIEDKSPDVVNPMNRKITVVLNDGGDNDE